jgi:hypothetical protein
MQSFALTLFADYRLFYIKDEAADGDLSDSWDDRTTARLLAIAPGTIGVGTVRNTEVPVTIELYEREPEADFAAWDYIVEAALSIASGPLVVAGCTDYLPDAKRIPLAPGAIACAPLMAGSRRSPRTVSRARIATGSSSGARPRPSCAS